MINKWLGITALFCLLLGTGSALAEQPAHKRIWVDYSTEEGFPKFREFLGRKKWINGDVILVSGLMTMMADASGNIEPETLIPIALAANGLVDSDGNVITTITVEQFKAIGQGPGWWLPTESSVRRLENAVVKLDTTANYIAEKQRQLAENGNWDISVRPAENLLNIIEREAGDVESVAEAIAILREEIKAIKERTFTPEMNKALDARFAKQMATLRGEFDKKLNDLFDDTNKKFTEVNSKIVDLSSGQEMLRGQQEAFAEQFAETNQANSTQFEELGKADRELGKQFTELESSLAGLASNSGWKINLLFVLVGLCLIGIAWILWSQRSEKRKERSKLSLVSNSAHRSSVDYDPPESIPEEQLFDVRKAVGMR